MKTLFFLIISIFSYSQTLDNNWTKTFYGTGGGGFVTDVKIDRDDSNIYYGVTDNAGFVKSTDAGATWVYKHGFNFPVTNIASITLHPTDNDILFTSTIAGIWKSTDKGETWVNLRNGFPALTGTEPDAYFDNMNYLAIYPADPNIMICAWGGGYNRYADGGTSFDASHIDEIGYKTTNGGTTWTALGTTGITSISGNSYSTHDIEFHPTDSDIIYMSNNSGLYKSTDFAVTWSQLRSGRHGSIEIVKNNPSTVWVNDGGRTFTPNAARGLYRSTNDGSSFTKVNLPSENDESHWVVLLLDDDGDSLVCRGTARIWITADANAGTPTFTDIAFNNANVPQRYDGVGLEYMDVLKSNHDIMLKCTADGIFKSTNRGVNWSWVLSTTTNSGTSWTNRGMVNESGYSIKKFNDTLFLAFNDFNLDLSLDGGATWQTLQDDISSSLPALGDPNYNDAGDIIRHPLTGHFIVTIGQQNVYIISSSNLTSWTLRETMTDATGDYHARYSWLRVFQNAAGTSWKVYAKIGQYDLSSPFGLYLNNNTTDMDDWVRQGAPFATGDLNDLIQDPNSKDVLYAIKADAIYKSTDFGSTWNAVNEPSVTNQKYWNATVKPGNSNMIFVTNRGWDNPSEAGIFKSTNGGTSWSTRKDTFTVMRFADDINDFPVCRYNSDGTRLYYGWSANSPEGYTFKPFVYSEDDGETWFNIAGLGQTFHIEPDVTDPDIVYYIGDAGGAFKIELQTAAPPVADFSGTPTSGTAPLEVDFTDLSTNTPTSWAWDIDNSGTTDYTTQNPTHTYSSPGTYTVKLTATNAEGSDVETKVDYITVSSPPAGGKVKIRLKRQ